jgi:integrase
VSLGAETVARLRAHKAAQAAIKLRNRQTYTDLGLVFAKEPTNLTTRTAKLGEPMLGILDRRLLERLTKAAGVRPIKFHGLRHTSASLLVAAGVSMVVGSKRLGHKKVSMTQDVLARPQGRPAGRGGTARGHPVRRMGRRSESNATGRYEAIRDEIGGLLETRKP